MQALVSQMMQLSICNRQHDLQERFCRLLLSRLDRVQGDTVEISHDLLADALGTSAEKLTRLAMDFWSIGLIDQAAGHIRVLDRSAIKERACDCYQAVREQYDRLLPGWHASARQAPGPKATPSLAGYTGRPELKVAGAE